MVAVAPVYERGHHCPTCRVVTLHRYVGIQTNGDQRPVIHIWKCSECETTAYLDSPQEVGRRCFKLAIKRLRQRRAARRWG